jgi:hypothetical protein
MSYGFIFVAVTFVVGVGIGASVPLGCPEHNSVTISQIESKLDIHASFNYPKCSAQELLLCIA